MENKFNTKEKVYMDEETRQYNPKRTKKVLDYKKADNERHLNGNE